LPLIEPETEANPPATVTETKPDTIKASQPVSRR
jgi:hypothetical protein